MGGLGLLANELVDQPRLSDTRFALDKDGAAETALRGRPQFVEPFQFVVAAQDGLTRGQGRALPAKKRLCRINAKRF